MRAVFFQELAVCSATLRASPVQEPPRAAKNVCQGSITTAVHAWAAAAIASTAPVQGAPSAEMALCLSTAHAEAAADPAPTAYPPTSPIAPLAVYISICLKAPASHAPVDAKLAPELSAPSAIKATSQLLTALASPAASCHAKPATKITPRNANHATRALH